MVHSPGESLREELDRLHVAPGKQRNFEELMHTAHETGLLDYKIYGEDAKTLIKLVAIAGNVGQIPSRLRM